MNDPIPSNYNPQNHDKPIRSARESVTICLALVACVLVGWDATGNVDSVVLDHIITKLGEVEELLSSVTRPVSVEDIPF